MAIICPRCGAENPDDAKSCNLCFKRFYDEPEREAPVEVLEEEETQAVAAEPLPAGRQVQVGAAKEKEDVAGSTGAGFPLKAAMNGGVAALTGVAFFLGSLGMIQVFGLGLESFFFIGRTIQMLNLTVFLMSVYLFALVTGGVFGNVMDRPNSVLMKRSIAASISLSIWLVLVYFLIVRNAGAIVVTTTLSIYTAAMLVAYVIAGTLVALGDGVEKGLTSDLVWYETAGGAAGSLASVVPVILSMLLLSSLVSVKPETTVDIAWFVIKVGVNAVVVGFLAGFSFWSGCEYFRRLAAKRR